MKKFFRQMNDDFGCLFCGLFIGSIIVITTTTEYSTGISFGYCFPQGPCDDGYVDSTNGNWNYWGCGSNCEGGRYYTNIGCACACVTADSVSCGMFQTNVSCSVK